MNMKGVSHSIPYVPNINNNCSANLQNMNCNLCKADIIGYSYMRLMRTAVILLHVFVSNCNANWWLVISLKYLFNAAAIQLKLKMIITTY